MDPQGQQCLYSAVLRNNFDNDPDGDFPQKCCVRAFFKLFVLHHKSFASSIIWQEIQIYIYSKVIPFPNHWNSMLGRLYNTKMKFVKTFGSDCNAVLVTSAP